MREFKLYRSYATVMFVVVGPIIGLASAAILVFFGAVRGYPGPVLPGALIVAAMLCGGAIFILRIPTRIYVADDGTVEFVGPLRRTRVALAAISQIRPSATFLGYLSVSFEGKALLLLPSFDGFHEFLVAVKEANKWVELRGC